MSVSFTLAASEMCCCVSVLAAVMEKGLRWPLLTGHMLFYNQSTCELGGPEGKKEA